MPKIEIKHFIAYLTYNNNRDSFNFEEADAPYDINRKIQVNFTTCGAAVFLHKNATFKQKLAYYQNLQEALVKQFGKGFSVVMAPESDCSNQHEIAYFCDAMKKLDPAILTVVNGGGWHYAPDEEAKRLRSLSDDWKIEPYCSAKILSGVGRPQKSDSVTAQLKAGIDYVTNDYSGVRIGYDVIYDFLGIDRGTIPLNDFSKDVIVEVNKRQGAKIQQIADQAFVKAMAIPDPHKNPAFER